MLCYRPGRLSEHVTHSSYYIIYLCSTPIHNTHSNTLSTKHVIMDVVHSLSLFPAVWCCRYCRELFNKVFFFCLVENTKMKRGQQLCHQGDSAYLTLNKPGCNCGFHFIDREASHLLEINKTNMCNKSCTFSRLLKINKVPELEIKT